MRYSSMLARFNFGALAVSWCLVVFATVPALAAPSDVNVVSDSSDESRDVLTDSYILDTTGTVDEPSPSDSSMEKTFFERDWLVTGLDVSLITGAGKLPSFAECRFFLRRDTTDVPEGRSSAVIFRHTWIGGIPESAHYNFADPIRISSKSEGAVLTGSLGTTVSKQGCRAIVVIRGRGL
ncbi:MAG: hypothetical protein ACR2P1_03210 [Pseudomonadales bacterium]